MVSTIVFKWMVSDYMYDNENYMPNSILKNDVLIKLKMRVYRTRVYLVTRFKMAAINLHF